MSDSLPSIKPHDPYAALRYRDFRLLFISRLFGVIGEQMAGVAVGWELYERTKDALYLGLVGLVQIIPVVLLSIPAGAVADRYNRKHVVAAAQTLSAIGSGGLLFVSFTQGAIPLFYFFLLLIGIARAFNNPAGSALLAQCVPPEAYTNAATYSSSSWQLASVIGPGLGGLLIAIFRLAWPIYLIDLIAALSVAGLTLMIRSKQKKNPQDAKEPINLATLAAGGKFVWKNKVILGAITLDMVAVLLGGATALLPVFADMLNVGPTGLGVMRAAPSVGALLMALFLTRRAGFTEAGKTLLWAVWGFGLATVIFGLSQSFLLSVIMLFILGGLDQISVVIRGTLLLTKTPDAMRGRVSAVNSVFIGLSNELGAFESGVAARLLGAVGGVVFGGIGTMIVVFLMAFAFPDLRRLERLDPDEE
jgi:MFS family permease